MMDIDVKTRYEELKEKGLINDRWELTAYGPLEMEDKFIIAVAEWTNDIMENTYSTSVEWEDRINLLFELYGEPTNPLTRECLMFCKGAYHAYQYLTSRYGETTYNFK